MSAFALEILFRARKELLGIAPGNAAARVAGQTAVRLAANAALLAWLGEHIESPTEHVKRENPDSSAEEGGTLTYVNTVYLHNLWV